MSNHHKLRYVLVAPGVIIWLGVSPSGYWCKTSGQGRAEDFDAISRWIDESMDAIEAELRADFVGGKK